MPNGTYDLTGPVCGSTGKAPEYPAASYRLALFDFDDLSERSLTLDGLAVKEVFRGEGCLVTISHAVYQNYDGIYSARHDRKFVYEPLGCTLAVTAAGTTLRAGPTYSDLMKDSDDRTEELPFQVQTNDDRSYEMTSQDLPELNALWATYGCAQLDRIKVKAVRRSITN